MRDLEEGHVYLEHLRLEHKQLHQGLRNTEAALFEVLNDDATSGRHEVVVERLSDLRHQLAAHFAREENGGCLEEAVLRVPRLAPEVGRLEREHVGLLATLDELVCQSSTLTPEKTKTRFREFKRWLTGHEAAENRVMAEGFGCNFSDEVDDLQ